MHEITYVSLLLRAEWARIVKNTIDLQCLKRADSISANDRLWSKAWNYKSDMQKPICHFYRRSFYDRRLESTKLINKKHILFPPTIIIWSKVWNNKLNLHYYMSFLPTIVLWSKVWNTNPIWTMIFHFC